MRWLDRYGLTSVEKRGFLFLAGILLILLTLRVSVLFWPESIKEYPSTLAEDVESWQIELKASMLVPHKFDPNTVQEPFIHSLKLNDFVKKNWIKFRNKNRFNKREDLLSIYGMDSIWFEVNKDSVIILPEIESTPTKSSPIHYFQFDPNSASKEEFIELGFPSWLAERVLNYREKGGSFTEPRDLLKIYDFPESLYRKIEPYIVISKIEKVDSHSQQQAVIEIELNQSDSTSLLELPGIGPVFAKRIVDYRDLLGGYRSENQLLEVYGFDQTRLNQITNQITIDENLIQQISLNEATFKELLAHPYLNFEQVKAIVNYREIIGPHQSISDLRELEPFTNKDVERLQPYLSVK